MPIVWFIVPVVVATPVIGFAVVTVTIPTSIGVRVVACASGGRDCQQDQCGREPVGSVAHDFSSRALGRFDTRGRISPTPSPVRDRRGPSFIPYLCAQQGKRAELVPGPVWPDLPYGRISRRNLLPPGSDTGPRAVCAKVRERTASVRTGKRKSRLTLAGLLQPRSAGSLAAAWLRLNASTVCARRSGPSTAPVTLRLACAMRSSAVA